MNLFNINREMIDDYFKTHPKTPKLLGAAAWVAGAATGVLTVPGLDPTMFGSIATDATVLLETFPSKKYSGENDKIVDGILSFVGNSKEKQQQLLDILNNYIKLAGEIEKAEFDDFMDTNIGSDKKFKNEVRSELKKIESRNAELHDAINNRFVDLHYKPALFQQKLEELDRELATSMINDGQAAVQDQGLNVEFPSGPIKPGQSVTTIEESPDEFEPEIKIIEEGDETRGFAAPAMKMQPKMAKPASRDHYNDLQCLAAHNSYHSKYFNKKRPTIQDVIKYQLIDCKARGLEYDVYETPELSQGGTFEALVAHEPVIKANAKKHVYLLSEWLKGASEVLDSMGNHEPVVIHIEAKKITNKKEFPDRLDTTIDTYFAKKLYTPADFEANLNEWPSKEELHGKVIFVLSGILANLKEKYDQREYKRAFVDATPAEFLFDARMRHRSFINFYADVYKMTLNDLLVNTLSKQKKVMRAWRANKKKTLQDLMFRGVQLLATDILQKPKTYKKANPFVLPPSTGFQFLSKLPELRNQILKKKKK